MLVISIKVLTLMIEHQYHIRKYAGVSHPRAIRANNTEEYKFLVRASLHHSAGL